MEPALGMAALWILFGGTHVGLATSRVREPLINRFGQIGFNAIFSLIAAVSLTLLVTYYAAHRYEGAAGLDLGRFALCHWLLIGMIAFGVVLMVAGLVSYPRSPYALFSEGMPSPRGIQRITRHPFFSGVALFSLAHVLLATRLVGATFAAGLAFLSILGARHQDAKFLAQRGRPYADYLAATSMIPFAAVAAGRQRFVWNEVPFAAFGIGLVVAIVLRAVHDGIFSFGGAWFVGTILIGAGSATIRSWRATQRRRRPDSRRLSGSERLPARLLYVIAVGHVVVGIALFQEPLAAIWRDGVVNSIGSPIMAGTDSWLGTPQPQFDREAAFWFVLFGPCLWILGQAVQRAIELADSRLLRLLGWDLFAVGIVGAAIMPVSGFWLMIPFAPLLFGTASRLEEMRARMGSGLPGELRWSAAEHSSS